MHKKYYVAVKAQLNENHAVHKEGCPFLPDQEKRIYLGEFAYGKDALKEGQQYFRKSKGCIFCSNEINSQEKCQTLSGWVSDILPAAIETPAYCQESQFCCLN